MKLMILAGEVSGDSHAASLVRELKKMDPKVQFFGMGGPAMRAAGVRLFYHLNDLAILGLWEVVLKYFHFRRIFNTLKQILSQEKPAALILVDFPGFNVRFARVAKKLNVPVLYYVSPQIWAWGRRRRRTIARRVDKMLVLFPFEKEIYQGTGLDVEYVGHPSLDKLACVAAEEKSLRRALKIAPEEILIGLLPGSRRHEVERIFPVLLEAAAEIFKKNPRVRFVASAVNGEAAGTLSSLRAGRPLPLEIQPGNAHQIMKEADLVLVASGTATLECAFFTTPMLIVYKVSPITWWVGRRVVRLPYIGLANVMAGRKIVPEFLQGEAQPGAIAAAALSLLDSAPKRSQMIEELKKVKASLGESGASLRAAQAIHRFLSEQATARKEHGSSF